MQRFLKENDSDELRAYIVFVPMLDEDDEAALNERVREFTDQRLTYFWDPALHSGLAWQTAYDLDTIAWDVYFLYRSGAVWTGGPTRAHYAMTGHRAVGEVIRTLRIEQFSAQARKMLED